LLLYKKMNFCFFELFFQTPDNRSGKYDIADRAESYDEKFNQYDQVSEDQIFLRELINKRMASQYSSFVGLFSHNAMDPCSPGGILGSKIVTLS
jgi:hypothetical protein